MMPRLLVLGVAFSCLLLADEDARQKVHVTTTEHLDFPPGGTLRLQNSTGELTVEGWERPDAEVTVTKSTVDAYDPREKESAAKKLDGVSVKTERRGDELDILTTSRRRHSVELEYSIKVPSNIRLIVNHKAGEVHVDNLSGDVDVKVSQGETTLSLAPEGQYDIDAKSALGTVNSDFPGVLHRRLLLFGHRFVDSMPAAPHKLHLRIGYGDIMILKMAKPPTPAPLSSSHE
jgi:hypothetical protein